MNATLLLDEGDRPVPACVSKFCKVARRSRKTHVTFAGTTAKQREVSYEELLATLERMETGIR